MKKKTIASDNINKIVAYLRVTSAEQDTRKNREDIVKFADDRGFGDVKFLEEQVSGIKGWKESRLKNIIDDLGDGGKLIVPQLSGLGKSMLEIMEILAIAKEKNIAIYDVKNNRELNGNIQPKVLAMMFNIAAEIERDLISKRTKEGLKAAKEKGKQLGRPKGIGKSRLDKYKDEIIALKKTGSTQVYIAKKYGTTQPNLYNWLRKHKLEDIKPVY